ncbi:hypothetical protein DPMN_018587 [Dreissena polymorpha]|uniref:Uncharacterized protein n=1 Tax=Dreissena polymorpha TaxID=45954 RepID=A0A9D4NHK6_DREPO|nr:hypothetical protein DPMN_018587 [Dreissena polymorpha]
MSTFSGSRQALWALTKSPAVEKILSLGTDVPCITRYLDATCASTGYVFCFSLHHFRGSPYTPGWVRTCSF